MSKEKFNIEYNLLSVSPSVLWSYIGTASGLSNWFADHVAAKDKRFTFTWSKQPQEANQIGARPGVFIRFRWDEDRDSRYFFEFRIHQIELTGSTVLEVTDFAMPDELEDSIDLWNTQIDALKRKIGV
jgi:uncharacterized protein YndB with AHSA1/START domain